MYKSVISSAHSEASRSFKRGYIIHWSDFLLTGLVRLSPAIESNQDSKPKCSRAWFSSACFPALGAGYMFSRAWHWLHVFPRLALVTCFAALSADYLFNHAWRELRVLGSLLSVLIGLLCYFCVL